MTVFNNNNDMYAILAIFFIFLYSAHGNKRRKV